MIAGWSRAVPAIVLLCGARAGVCSVGKKRGTRLRLAVAAASFTSADSRLKLLSRGPVLPCSIDHGGRSRGMKIGRFSIPVSIPVIHPKYRRNRYLPVLPNTGRYTGMPVYRHIPKTKYFQMQYFQMQ